MEAEQVVGEGARGGSDGHAGDAAGVARRAGLIVAVSGSAAPLELRDDGVVRPHRETCAVVRLDHEGPGSRRRYVDPATRFHRELVVLGGRVESGAVHATPGARLYAAQGRDPDVAPIREVGA